MPPIRSPQSTDHGGTGQNFYNDGEILVGNSATRKVNKTTITPGLGIQVTNANGSITIGLSGEAGTPVGGAGGDLAGTYPNPTLKVIGSGLGPVGDGAHVAAVTIDTKGRVTGLSSVSIAIAGSQITSGTVSASYLPTFGAAASGIVGASGGGTTNFLRADGTWAAPSGSGSVTSVAQTVPAGFAVSGTPITTSGTLAISYASGQSANLALATPDNTTGALSLRSLVARDLASSPLQGTILYASSATGMAWLGTSTSGYVLTTGGASANPAWTAPTALFTGAQYDMLYFSASNTLAATAALTFDGNKLTVTPGSGNQVLEGVASNPVIALLSNSNTTNTQSGSGIGRILFEGYSNSAAVTGAVIDSYAEATWTSSSTPTTIRFQTTPVSSTTNTTALLITANRNIITNGNGSNLAQSATDGFLYVPFIGANTPSGTPTSYTGNIPMCVYQNSTTYRVYFYVNGGWHYATLT